MDDHIQKTINTYDIRANEYIESTPIQVFGSMKDWIDKAVMYIPKNGSILEIGSGSGRDAEYIESLGYKVQRTDAAQSFVDFLIKKGYQARLLNAITDDFGGLYSMIFANSVLLHFDVDDTRSFLANAYKSLLEDGILAFSVIQGDGDLWTKTKLSAPRYFHYWRPADLKNEIIAACYAIVEFLSCEYDGKQWLFVIARKS